MPGIVAELLRRPITLEEYEFLCHTSGVPWCMRARLINKYRRQED